MTGRKVIVLAGVFGPPLVDPATREPYRTLPCMTDPERWDLDVDGETSHAARVRRAAARLVCLNRCEAKVECFARRTTLGPLATGVWGGKTYGQPRQGDDNDVTITAWATQAGVTLPTTRGVGSWRKAAAPGARRTAPSTG